MYRQFRRIIACVLALVLCATMPALADIAKGAKGEEVRTVQRLLEKLGYLSSKADGSFGSGTEKAVKAFQTAEGLTASGVVDDATNQKLMVRFMEKPSVYPMVLNFENNTVVGRNATGMAVMHVLAIIYDPEDVGMQLETVSWTDDVTVYNSKPYEIDTGHSFSESASKEEQLEGWENSKTGSTSAFYVSLIYDDRTLNEKVIGRGMYIMLPDDESLAGPQTVVLDCNGYQVTIDVELSYLGNYTDGNGWFIHMSGVKAELM